MVVCVRYIFELQSTSSAFLLHAAPSPLIFLGQAESCSTSSAFLLRQPIYFIRVTGIHQPLPYSFQAQTRWWYPQTTFEIIGVFKASADRPANRCLPVMDDFTRGWMDDSG